MHVCINENEYEVFIEKKMIKNMYLRVKDDGIHITANYLVNDKTIKKFIENNTSFIERAMKKRIKAQEKEKYFYYLGNKYNIILLNTAKKAEIYDDNIYVKNKEYLNTFLKNEAQKVFNERLKICYDKFTENIPFPTISIWKMKRKWGYCNKNKKLIKINFELIKHSISEIDYVIIHELCHFIEFNHSKNFWKLVKKYCNNYKEIQLKLKEE